MNREPIEDTSDLNMLSLLDRLVCGELDEETRGAVLNWLDANPGRWRQCGLAFLEAQTWSRALSTQPSAKIEEVIQNTDVTTTNMQPRKRRRLTVASLAACVLVAFGCGFVANHALNLTEWHTLGQITRSEPQAARIKDSHRANQQTEPLLASIAMQPTSAASGNAVLQIPVAPAIQTKNPTAIPDYVRSQWERQGYQLSVERRYVLGNLPDGEQIAVPVERVRANYVGMKVY